MYKNKYEILTWLTEYAIPNFKINEDLSVDVIGNVIIVSEFIDELPVNFNIVVGDFTIKNTELKSLIGFPKEITGNLDCSYNKLKNLMYFPKIVGKSIDISNNALSSLKGCIKYISGDLYMMNNNIKSFKDGPEYIEKFLQCKNNSINSLLDFPKYIGGSIDLSCNKLISMIGLPEEINGSLDLMSNKIKYFDTDIFNVKGDINLSSNPLESLKNIPYIGSNVYLSNTKIEDLNYLQKIIHGTLVCCNTKIVNLYNSPTHIHGNFLCLDNKKLESLVSNIEYVEGKLNFKKNKLIKNKIKDYNINSFDCLDYTLEEYMKVSLLFKLRDNIVSNKKIKRSKI